MISKYIDKLREGESLQADESEQCLSAILESNLPDEQIAELLIAFSEKDETADEILGFSRALLAKSRPVPLSSDAIDSCGTGGSGLNRLSVYKMTGKLKQLVGIAFCILPWGITVGVQSRYKSSKMRSNRHF